MRKQQRIYLPKDVIEVVKNCRTRNKFIVTTMTQEDCVTSSPLDKNTVNRKHDMSGNPISWLDTREILLLKAVFPFDGFWLYKTVSGSFTCKGHSRLPCCM